ncbi:Os04g0450400, partial [Oryza sativa Japonica Group]
RVKKTRHAFDPASDLPPTFLRTTPARRADAAGESSQVVAHLLTASAMPLHHRRALHSNDCDDGGYGCSSWPLSPPPPSVILTPFASPSPAPWACPPAFPAPSPSPLHGAAGGRRDQGGYHGSPPGGGGDADEHRRRIINLIVVGAAALAFLSMILLVVIVAVRRRRLRRRRQRQQALLAPAAPADAVAVNVEDGGDDDAEGGGGGGGGGGVVHHIWYIRTVGLDEAAIDSIAATRYRAGAGLLGAADCSVCLGEFQDGELVRLLPKCGHAFHVPCIDTWLRAHVNCPLCRSDVLGPAATATESGGGDTGSMPQADPVANTIAAAQQAAAPGDAILERQEEEEEAEQEDQGAPPHMEENRQEQSSSPDPLPPPRNVRRAASMDAAIVSTAAEVAALERLPEAAPEEEQSGGGGGGDKRGGAPGASCLKVSSSGRLSNLGAAERLPRSFFSRHCRARSSVLPL